LLDKFDDDDEPRIDECWDGIKLLLVDNEEDNDKLSTFDGTELGRPVGIILEVIVADGTPLLD